MTRAVPFRSSSGFVAYRAAVLTVRRGLCILAGAAIYAAAPALGQCQPTWSTLPHVGQATAFATYDEDGDGPAPPLLFIGGVSEIGVDRGPVTTTIAVLNIARGDGWDWYEVGGGLGSPLHALHGVFGISRCKRQNLHGLYASDDSFWNYTTHRGIARWRGAQWDDVGNGFALGYATKGLVFDEGDLVKNLIVAGPFSLVQKNGKRLGGIARWDGYDWTFLGTGLPHATAALSMAVFDEGDPVMPPPLFVAGTFRTAGGIDAWRIARWDCKSWSTVGELGVNGAVEALCVFDAGDGPMLYVGGSFSRVGGPSNWITAPRLARWDGKEWSAVPGWTAPGGGNVRTMAVWDDDGPGPNKPALFIGGYFFGAAGTNASSIIKWDGERWDDMQGGVTGFGRVVDRIHAFDDDHDGPNPGGLYIGGGFTYAGGVLALGLARWGCPVTPPCLADCDFSTGFGVLDVFDFLCFANRFHAGAPYACDCDTSTGHGVCDIFDFLCFGQRFIAGCS